MSSGNSPTATPHSFPLWLKENVLRLMLPVPGKKTEPANNDLVAFIGAFNAFLQCYNLQPIEIPEFVGTGLPLRICNLFDDLKTQESSFNGGEEAQSRVESREENLAMGEMLAALCEYVTRKKLPLTNFRDKSFSVIPKPLCEENKCPRLWERTLSTDGTSNFEEKNVVDFSKKAVICIGGATSIHDDPRTLNGFAKMAEGVLGGPGIYKEGIGVYCLSHPTIHRSLYESRTCLYNSSPETFASENAVLFVKKHMLPTLGLTKENDKVSLEGLKGKLRKFNFFTFSYGTVFVKEIENALTRVLKERGYTKEEIRGALAEVYTLNIGCTGRFDIEKEYGNFSAIYVVSNHDIVSRSRINAKKWLQNTLPTGPALIRIRDNELLVWTNSPKTGYILEQVSEREPTDAPGLGLLSKISHRAGHSATLYTARMPTNEPAVIERPLRHAVAGYRFPNPFDMLSPITLTSGTTTHGAAPPAPLLMRVLDNLIGNSPGQQPII